MKEQTTKHPANFTSKKDKRMTLKKKRSWKEDREGNFKENGVPSAAKEEPLWTLGAAGIKDQVQRSCTPSRCLCTHTHTPEHDISSTLPSHFLALLCTEPRSRPHPPLTACSFMIAWHVYWPRLQDNWKNWSSPRDLAYSKPHIRLKAVICVSCPHLHIHEANVRGRHLTFLSDFRGNIFTQRQTCSYVQCSVAFIDKKICRRNMNRLMCL